MSSFLGNFLLIGSLISAVLQFILCRGKNNINTIIAHFIAVSVFKLEVGEGVKGAYANSSVCCATLRTQNC